MRGHAVVLGCLLALVSCSKPAADPAPELVGSYTAADGKAIAMGFQAIDLRADGSYVGDNGLQCDVPPCPTAIKGSWQSTDFKGTKNGTIWLDGVSLGATIDGSTLTLARGFGKSVGRFEKIVEDAPEAAKPAPDLAGSYRLTGESRDPGLVSFVLAADGTYTGDTGIRCVRAPCNSHESGAWGSDGKGVFVFRTAGKPARRYALIRSKDAGSIDLGRGGEHAVYRREP